MSTNVDGVFHRSRAALPALKQSRGCIVNTASIVLTLFASSLVMTACEREAPDDRPAVSSDSTPPISPSTAPSELRAATPPASPSGDIDDALITSKVKAALLTTAKLESGGIQVETTAGRVILSGSVATREDVATAATVARGIDGVNRVDNRLIAVK